MIDPAKKYTTRDGREVRIYATDGSGDWPVQGAIKYNGGWLMSEWKADGGASRYGLQLPSDLIEAKTTVTRWINIYGGEGHTTRQAADEAADRSTLCGRIACIQITYKEGDGL